MSYDNDYCGLLFNVRLKPLQFIAAIIELVWISMR